MEFASEINLNKMILSPGGACAVWNYDWLVPGESDEDSNADGANQDSDSEVNCVTLVLLE